MRKLRTRIANALFSLAIRIHPPLDLGLLKGPTLICRSDRIKIYKAEEKIEAGQAVVFGADMTTIKPFDSSISADFGNPPER